MLICKYHSVCPAETIHIYSLEYTRTHMRICPATITCLGRLVSTLVGSVLDVLTDKCEPGIGQFSASDTFNVSRGGAVGGYSVPLCLMVSAAS